MRPDALDAASLPRVLGRVEPRDGGGPALFVTAGIHGNEPAGVLALQRVLATIDHERIHLSGRLVGFVGNKSALARNVRNLDEDMNRLWSAARIAALRTRSPRGDNVEEGEQRELLAALEAELALPFERVSHLDLHSTSGDGPPFTVIAGPPTSRALANELPVPLLLGLEGIIGGTLIEWMGARGVSTCLLEGGQNEAPATIDHHEAAVWLALVQSGVLGAEQVVQHAQHRSCLQRAARELPSELEIAYCHRLDEGEEFSMVPGFASFDAVAEGQLLARSGPGLQREVRAPWSGTLLMPRYQGQGLDGFFLGRRVAG